MWPCFYGQAGRLLRSSLHNLGRAPSTLIWAPSTLIWKCSQHPDLGSQHPDLEVLPAPWLGSAPSTLIWAPSTLIWKCSKHPDLGVFPAPWLGSAPSTLIWAASLLNCEHSMSAVQVIHLWYFTTAASASRYRDHLSGQDHPHQLCHLCLCSSIIVVISQDNGASNRPEWDSEKW